MAASCDNGLRAPAGAKVDNRQRVAHLARPVATIRRFAQAELAIGTASPALDLMS
jgi:hypothetical protein